MLFDEACSERRDPMPGRRSRMIFFVTLLSFICGVGAQWVIQAFGVPTPPDPAFQRPQWIELQIVTAPTQSTLDGYVYDEAKTIVHSTHRILIDPMGNGRSFYSVSDDVPIELTYASAELLEDGNGILLKDLSFHFPLRFRVNEHKSFASWSFTTRDTSVHSDFHDFKRDVWIYSQEHPLSSTFIRMRHVGEMKELPVIDLAPAIGE